MFLVEYKQNQDAKLMATGQCPGPGESKIALSPDGRTVALAINNNIYMYMAATADEEGCMTDVHDGEYKYRITTLASCHVYTTDNIY